MPVGYLTPVRDTQPIACPRVRALTLGETAELLARLRADPAAVRLNLPDFVEFMLGTGVRIGEACAVREAALDLEVADVRCRTGSVSNRTPSSCVSRLGPMSIGPCTAGVVEVRIDLEPARVVLD